MEKEEVVNLLNQMQAEKWIKITSYSPLEITLRKKLENEIEVKLDFIEEYSKLWHGIYSGIKPRGYYLAQPVSVNLNRMQQFCKEHPQFSKDVILQATRNYLASKELVNYEYCKKSQKFIVDTDGSELFSWCLGVVNGEELKEKDNFKSL